MTKRRCRAEFCKALIMDTCVDPVCVRGYGLNKKRPNSDMKQAIG